MASGPISPHEPHEVKKPITLQEKRAAMSYLEGLQMQWHQANIPLLVEVHEEQHNAFLEWAKENEGFVPEGLLARVEQDHERIKAIFDVMRRCQAVTALGQTEGGALRTYAAWYAKKYIETDPTR